MKSLLKDIGNLGQSIWIDALERKLIHGGKLARLIEADGICGLTSNPSIFEKAIDGQDYALALRKHPPGSEDPKAAYERIAIQDIQDAADVFAPLYHHTERRDGYVSLEVAPDLAHTTQGTLDEARRLWRRIGRDNVMIKVPGTPEGIAATEQLISEGINVNVTLLFALEIYEQVAAAYRRGLERLRQHGGDLSRVASVASFFISRIDEAVDQAVDAQQKVTTTSSMKELLSLLYGKVAISSAKQTYQTYLKIIHSDGWQALARQGARPQRLLWASTGVKNPQYRDVLYAEELIGKDTINTLPLATMDAFRDHGIAKDSLTSQLSEADRILNICTQVGIPLSTITDKLLVDGLRKFAEAFASLLRKVALLGNDAAPAAVSDPTKLSYSDFQSR